MGAAIDKKLTLDARLSTFLDKLADGERIQDAAAAANVSPHLAEEWMRQPFVAIALRAELQRRLLFEGLPGAYKAMLDLLHDKEASPTARSRAAFVVLRFADDSLEGSNKKGKATKELGNMTAEELEREAAELQAELADAHPIPPATAIA